MIDKTFDEIQSEMTDLKTTIQTIFNELGSTGLNNLKDKADELEYANDKLVKYRNYLEAQNANIDAELQKIKSSDTNKSYFDPLVEPFSQQSEIAMDKLEDLKQSNIRQAQINRFYSDKYAAYTQLFRLVVSTLIPIIFLLIIKKKRYIRSDAFRSLIIVVFIIGGIFILKKFIDILSRSNANFQELDWKFRVPDEDENEND